MRILLLFSLAIALTGDAAAQNARRAPQTARGGIALTVTDQNGATLQDVLIEMTGPVARDGKTDASGQLSFPGLGAGTYRLRFTGEAIAAFEREVTLRAGQIEKLVIRLTAAPPPPPPPAPEPPQPPPPPPLGPAGQPHVLSLVDVVERELVTAKEPRKDTLVACSGNTRSMLVQLNEPQATRVYTDAEALYYVIAGEGAINLEGEDVPLAAGIYAALPRAAAHSITRKGRRPLIMLAILSGEPCEVAR
jgi:mannose-6-phosphate isomerase-like protein (cupin superfamily)